MRQLFFLSAICGTMLLVVNMVKIKKYLTVDELIETLINKGIIVDDKNKTKELLKQYNYYLLMGYKFLFINNGKYT